MQDSSGDTPVYDQRDLPVRIVGTVGNAFVRPTELRNGTRAFYTAYGKRIFDIVVALAAILLVLPVLPVLILGLVIEDGLPILYRQRRIGEGGRSFSCLKFRSMVRDADVRLARLLATCPDSQKEWFETQKLQRDPRIHRVGALLRRSSLDELPQFWNVLCGEMSIVGPRPILPEQIARYRDQFAGYAKVKPGLTGPWQIGGRSRLSFEQRIQLDSGYAQTVSFIGDCTFLLKTVRVVLAGSGSC